MTTQGDHSHGASGRLAPRVAPMLVLMGPPGAGRGTQARLLSKRLSRPRISTGDMLREMAQSDTDLGREIRAAQAGGHFVGDDVVTRAVRERAGAEDCRSGVVFHGFPATIAQAEALESMVGNRADVLALAITVPHEVLFQRLSGRRVCASCGEIFNVYTSPSLVEGVCDHDGGRLVQRPDDAEETVKSRLMAYHHSTAPLFGYYRESGRLVEIDGDRPVGEVFEELCSEIGFGVC